MKIDKKLTLAALSAAALATAAMFWLVGPAGEMLEHLLRHRFDSLSPAAQGRVATFARIFAVSAPALAAAVAATVANRQRARRAREHAGMATVDEEKAGR